MTRLVVALALLLGVWVMPAEAQTTSINDIEVQQFFLPGTRTSGWRAHANRAEMNLTLAGDLYARGGYKVAYAFSHNSATTANTNSHAPVAGLSTINTGGSLNTNNRFIPMPYGGSVIAVTVSSHVPLTAGMAHAEATIFTPGGGTYGAAEATGLKAQIGVSGQNQSYTQHGWVSQSPNVDVFNPPATIGCKVGASTDVAPIPLLTCTVIVEF